MYTSGRLVPGMLLKIPEVRRHQTGDGEARLLFPGSVLPQVAACIRARKRRILSPDVARNLGSGTAYRATLSAKDGPLTADPTVTMAEADLERSLRTETRLADDAPDPA